MANAPSENLRQIFLAMTASLTGSHLCIFEFLAKPEKFGVPVDSWRELEQYQGDGPWHTHTWDTIRKHVPGMPDNNDVIQHCFTDLVSQGIADYRGGGSLPGITFPALTNFGWGYYAFIIDADAEDGETRS